MEVGVDHDPPKPLLTKLFRQGGTQALAAHQLPQPVYAIAGGLGDPQPHHRAPDRVSMHDLQQDIFVSPCTWWRLGTGDRRKLKHGALGRQILE